MPAQLRELMRHESIETTLRYYVGTNAERTADACCDAFDRAGGAAQPAVVENSVPGACASQIVSQWRSGDAKTPFAPVAQVDRAWDF